MINIQPEKLWRKDYVIVMLASAGISFCNYFFSSTLPIYAQNLTGTAAYSGLMMGVYTFAALAARPFSGFLSDRFGRTRILILGALISSIVCLLYNFATVLIILIFMRVLHGIGFSIHSTSSGAVAGDVIPKSRLSEGIGYFGLYGTLAMAIAPGVALSIIGNGEMHNFRILFALAAAVSLLSMTFDCFITYERKNKNAVSRESLSHTPAGVNDEVLPKTFLGFEYAVFSPAAVSILFYIAISSIASFLPLFAIQRQLGNVGLFFTIDAVGLLLSRITLGRIADRRGPHRVIIPGIAVLAICLALIPFVHSLIYLILLALPVGAAQGAVAPAINALMFNLSSAKRRGTASAAFYSSIDLGYGVGSIAFGLIAAGLGYYFVYLGSAFFAVAALVVYLFAVAQINRRTKPAPDNKS